MAAVVNMVLLLFRNHGIATELAGHQLAEKEIVVLDPFVSLAPQDLLDPVKQGSAHDRLMHSSKGLAGLFDVNDAGIETVVEDAGQAIAGHSLAVPVFKAQFFHFFLQSVHVVAKPAVTRNMMRSVLM